MFTAIPKIRWKDLAALLLVIAIAFVVRTSYLENSQTSSPIRADAGKYFFTAYNWTHFDVYSASQYKPAAVEPVQRTIVPPAYPAYLIPFVKTTKTVSEFVARVTFSQALLSLLSVALTFALARLVGLGTLLSFFSALFMALCPHLVALDGYILSESLFVFLFLASLLTLMAGWLRQRYWLVFIAGAFLGLTALTRTAALGLCPFMLLLFAVDPVRRTRATLSKALAFSGLALLGFSCLYGPFVGYKAYLTSQGISLQGQSVWAHFVRGADVGLDDFMLNKRAPKRSQEYERMVDEPSYGASAILTKFKEEPLEHVGWYLYGKLKYMWKWDSTYVGDIYQYPMIKKGFEESKFLGAVRAAMRIVHWPLYALTLASPLVLFVLYRKKRHLDHLAVWLPMLAFAYFALLLTLLMPLPRYALPLRPVSYVLAMWTVATLFSLFKKAPPVNAAAGQTPPL